MAGVHMKLIALKDTQATWDMPEIVHNISIFSPSEFRHDEGSGLDGEYGHIKAVGLSHFHIK